jgi:hypothetical protein
MSFFTTLRNFVTAPVKSLIAVDPILSKITTGHFRGGITGYKQRVAGGVHEMYSQDRLLQKLGVKETSIVKVAVIAGYVVAIYFTAGAASGAMSGGVGAGVTAGEVESGLSIAMALDKANKQKKAAADAAAQNATAQQASDLAAKQSAIIAQADALKKSAVPAIGWATIAAAVALLL